MSNPPVIAIVDDDEAVREAIRDLLQVEGLTARTFDNAAAFLEGEGTGFDCIITDVRMPGMDGLQLQRLLRARGSTVPMIFITSLVNEATRSRALQDGAAAWFTKPVADKAVLDALHAILGAPGRPGDRAPPGS